MQVANTILAQLGGQRFVAMTGARNLMSDAHVARGCLSFKVGKNSKGVTHVRVTLTADDLYRLETLRVRKSYHVQVLARIEGVYADKLRDVFTAATGLDTHL